MFILSLFRVSLNTYRTARCQTPQAMNLTDIKVSTLTRQYVQNTNSLGKIRTTASRRLRCNVSATYSVNKMSMKQLAALTDQTQKHPVHQLSQLPRTSGPHGDSAACSADTCHCVQPASRSGHPARCRLCVCMNSLWLMSASRSGRFIPDTR
jgi:hypothetical protein